MGPSSCELTRPISAGDGATWAMAVSVTEHATIVARPTRIRRKNRFVFIITPRIGLHAIRTFVDIRIASTFALKQECAEIVAQCGSDSHFGWAGLALI